MELMSYPVEIFSTREPDASSDKLGIVQGWKEFIIFKVEMPCKVKDPQKSPKQLIKSLIF